jgi:hypothetical protein
VHGRFQGGRRSCDRPSDCVAGSVPLPDLRQAIADSHRLPLRARRHVAVDEGLGQQTRRWPELTEQVSREAALLGFGQGTRVMRDHPAQQKICAFDVAEIPGTV